MDEVIDVSNAKRVLSGFDFLMYLLATAAYIIFGIKIELEYGRMDIALVIFAVYLLSLCIVLVSKKTYENWTTLLLAIPFNYLLIKFLDEKQWTVFGYNSIVGKRLCHITFFVVYLAVLLASYVVTMKFNQCRAEKRNKYKIKEKLLNAEAALGNLDEIAEVKFNGSAMSDEDIFKKYGVDSRIRECQQSDEETAWMSDILREKAEMLEMINDDRYKYLVMVGELMNQLDYLQVSKDEKITFAEAWEFQNSHELGVEPAFYPYKVSDLQERMEHRVQKEILEPFARLKQRQTNLTTAVINFKKDINKTSLGYWGEVRVDKMLSQYTDQMLYLSNLRVEVEGQSNECDFIVLAPQGIFVLEVKNLGSKGTYGLHIEKDGRWIKTYGRSSEVMEGNPTEQNERHIIYLGKLINKELGRSMDNSLPVNGMVVIANDRVNITNETDQIVIRDAEVMRKIKNYPVIFKEKELHELKEILERNGLEPIPYDVENFMQHCYLEGIRLKEDYASWYETSKPLIEYTKKYKSTVLS